MTNEKTTSVTAEHPYDTRLLDMLDETKNWERIANTSLKVAELTPIKNDLTLTQFKDVISGAGQYFGDCYMHVVRYKDKYYIHKGHHLYAVALARGTECVRVRLIKL